MTYEIQAVKNDKGFASWKILMFEHFYFLFI